MREAVWRGSCDSGLECQEQQTAIREPVEIGEVPSFWSRLNASNRDEDYCNEG